MKVNGEETTFQKGMRLDEFLKSQGYDELKVAVECNGEIIPRDYYNKHELNDENSYEILVFVGGG
ncbi:MAG: sulfur carrier protein ThiS [Methanobrevibacter sp.]|jgi:thiamine biosynthesis protein ThiS|nr:sulfur carrier protein ThiS [Candidatus Methanovirga aequatorialis]